MTAIASHAPYATSTVRRISMMLLLFHFVLVGVRLRFGSFPLEIFFLISGLTLPMVFGPRYGRAPIDFIQILLFCLIGLRVVSISSEIIENPGYFEERVYFELHRMMPLFIVYWAYAWRTTLMDIGLTRIFQTMIVAGIILHGSATIGSALSEPVRELVIMFANILDAKSDQSYGAMESTYTLDEYGTDVIRSPGLLKYPAINAGYLGIMGALALALYSAYRRYLFVVAYGICVTGCVLTFSRGGLATLVLALLTYFAVNLKVGNIKRVARLGTFGLIAVALGVAMLSQVNGGANLAVATERFGQFFETDSFESANLKIASTQLFFDRLINDNLVVLYPGVGLNIVNLAGRGHIAFDPNEVGFASNSWLLFAFDAGFAYLLGSILLFASFFVIVMRNCIHLAIGLIPLIFVCATDNYIAVNFEMHALFWLSVVMLALCAMDRSLDMGTGKGAYQ
ncbi:MAG: hypothetical protein AAFR21_13705 [Pseudomonadota bacterium]